MAGNAASRVSIHSQFYSGLGSKNGFLIQIQNKLYVNQDEIVESF